MVDAGESSSPLPTIQPIMMFSSAHKPLNISLTILEAASFRVCSPAPVSTRRSYFCWR